MSMVRVCARQVTNYDVDSFFFPNHTHTHRIVGQFVSVSAVVAGIIVMYQTRDDVMGSK